MPRISSFSQRVGGAVAAAAAALLAAPAHADVASYQGRFIADDDLLQVHFTLAGKADVQAATQSWAGGGFAPVLALFSATAGELLRDGGHGPRGPAPGQGRDARLAGTLDAGDYTLVLSQDGNLPLGPRLDDGYGRAGQHDYTGRSHLGQPGMRFVDADGSARSGDYALTLQVSAVPRPASFSLLAALGLGRRA